MTKTVSIGICAYDEARRIPLLLDSLAKQGLPRDLVLQEIVIVASGCTDGTEAIVQEWAKRDPRIMSIPETARRGKSSALNVILRSFRGELLVLVNADAWLRPGSLERLLRPFVEDLGVEIACGAPVPEVPGSNLTRLVIEVLWRLHNRTLQVLSALGMPNHCCDELMAVRRGFVESFPRDLINDGAYLGVLASVKGRSVRFCSDAEVVVEAPRDLAGLLQQRRRILRGHRQVRTLLATPPSTLRGLLRGHPELVVRILREEVWRKRATALALLFVALPLEMGASLWVAMDRLRRRPYEAAWPTVSGF